MDATSSSTGVKNNYAFSRHDICTYHPDLAQADVNQQLDWSTDHQSPIANGFTLRANQHGNGTTDQDFESLGLSHNANDFASSNSQYNDNFYQAPELGSGPFVTAGIAYPGNYINQRYGGLNAAGYHVPIPPAPLDVFDSTPGLQDAMSLEIPQTGFLPQDFPWGTRAGETNPSDWNIDFTVPPLEANLTFTGNMESGYTSTWESIIPVPAPVAAAAPALSAPSSARTAVISAPKKKKPALEERIRCPEGCPRTFRREGDFRRHMKKHSTHQYQCVAAGCDKTFYRLDKMRSHAELIHNIKF